MIKLTKVTVLLHGYLAVDLHPFHLEDKVRFKSKLLRNVLPFHPLVSNEDLKTMSGKVLKSLLQTWF